MLDTSAYSYIERGDQQLLLETQQADEIALSVIVIAELKYGFAMGSKHRQNLAQLELFLDSPRVVVCDIAQNTTTSYVKLALLARKNGIALGANDLWIAALALQHGYKLLTKDQDFAVFARTIKLLGI